MNISIIYFCYTSYHFNLRPNSSQSWCCLEFQRSIVLESINSGVKSFLCGEKSVVLGVIKLILNFASHDKKSSSTIKQSCLTMYFNVKTKSNTSPSLPRKPFYETRILLCIHHRCPTIPVHPNGTEWNQPVQLTHRNSPTIFGQWAHLHRISDI